ncbi:MAG: EpsG family protein [Prevotella sp.]|nr:EpsG family protein [Prevotella sp.]
MLFAVSDFLAPDFWNYISEVESVWSFDYSEELHMEWIYQFFVFFVAGDYFLFRLLVWGGLLLIYAKVCKRWSTDTVAFMFLLLVFFSQFASSRANMGVAVYYLGLSFLLVPIPEKRKRSIVIALALIAFSSIFHSTMTMLIAFTPIILLPNLAKLSKKIIITFLVVVISLMIYVMNNPMEVIELLGSDTILKKFIFYMEEYDELEWGKPTGGISGWITFIVRELRMLTPVIILTFILRYKEENLPPIIVKTFNIVLAITMAAYTFRLMYPDVGVIALRMMNLTYPALALIVARMHTDKLLSSRQVYLLMAFPLLDTIYENIYRFYGGW